MTLRTLQIGMEWFDEKQGGLNRVYAHLLAELSSMGVESAGLVAGSAEVVRLSGGLARAFAPAKASAWRRSRALRAAAIPWLAANTRDAVIVSHFAPYALPLLDFARKRPFVVHFQGPWGQESRTEGASALTMYGKELVERRVYRAADAAIVLSAAFGDILASRFGIAREKIHVIPGGVEFARFAHAQSAAESRAALGWPQDRPIVLCVRRLVRRVGLDALVDAVAEVRRRVPDVLVLIAGTGPRRDVIAQHVASAGLESSVRLIGFVPDELLPLAYRAATLTVVPSLALEGFGLITVESLAAGTPCVVTPIGGLTDIIAPLSPQLVAASSRAADIAETLSAALTGAIELPSPDACAEYARVNFDWPVIAARVRQVYESVL
jgi:glycosyltransferase involved in cell wall biosynthesis